MTRRPRWWAWTLAGAGLLGSLGVGPLVASPAGGAAAVSIGPDAAGVTWLCRPGLPNDPCLSPEQADSVTASGSTTVINASPATTSKFDCFYIYPTVTAAARTDNINNLNPTAPEIGVAVAQASRFSQVCQVWSPTYKQRTAASLAKGLGNDPAADLISYNSLLMGWKDYLAHYNHGRPIILIGHSQGAANLIRLLRGQFDNNPKLRARLVAAIILGGNVQVPIGKTVGGTFKHIPACTSTHQTGCVIAYSSFNTTPPSDSLFGIPGQGVSLQSDQTQVKGEQVLCTNPADLGKKGPAALTPYFVSASGTAAPWVTYPSLYTATCMTKGDTTWLQIDSAKGDPRPVVSATLGPMWGLHGDDVNLALGNLIKDVRAEEASYTAHQ